MGKDVPMALPDLKHNAIQLICSSNYYYKNYYPHEDVVLPQIWPRKTLKEPLYTPEIVNLKTEKASIMPYPRRGKKAA